MKIANPGLRLLSWLINRLLWWTVVFLNFQYILNVGSLGQLLDRALGFVIAIIVYLLLSPFIESFLVSRFGGSPGKWLTGTVIVEENGKYLSYWKAFFRNSMGKVVSSLLFCLGFFWILIDKNRQAWHDMAVDSLVVVKNKLGWVIALISLIVLVVINLMILGSIADQLSQNRNFYQEMFTDLRSELEPSSDLQMPTDPSRFIEEPPSGDTHAS